MDTYGKSRRESSLSRANEPFLNLSPAPTNIKSKKDPKTQTIVDFVEPPPSQVDCIPPKLPGRRPADRQTNNLTYTPACVRANSRHSYTFAYTCARTHTHTHTHMRDHIHKRIHLHIYLHVYIWHCLLFRNRDNNLDTPQSEHKTRISPKA